MKSASGGGRSVRRSVQHPGSTPSTIGHSQDTSVINPGLSPVASNPITVAIPVSTHGIRASVSTGGRSPRSVPYNPVSVPDLRDRPLIRGTAQPKTPYVKIYPPLPASESAEEVKMESESIFPRGSPSPKDTQLPSKASQYRSPSGQSSSTAAPSYPSAASIYRGTPGPRRQKPSLSSLAYISTSGATLPYQRAIKTDPETWQGEVLEGFKPSTRYSTPPTAKDSPLISPYGPFQATTAGVPTTFQPANTSAPVDYGRFQASTIRSSKRPVPISSSVTNFPTYQTGKIVQRKPVSAKYSPYSVRSELPNPSLTPTISKRAKNYFPMGRRSLSNLKSVPTSSSLSSPSKLQQSDKSELASQTPKGQYYSGMGSLKPSAPTQSQLPNNPKYMASARKRIGKDRSVSINQFSIPGAEFPTTVEGRSISASKSCSMCKNKMICLNTVRDKSITVCRTCSQKL